MGNDNSTLIRQIDMKDRMIEEKNRMIQKEKREKQQFQSRHDRMAQHAKKTEIKYEITNYRLNKEKKRNEVLHYERNHAMINMGRAMSHDRKTTNMYHNEKYKNAVLSNQIRHTNGQLKHHKKRSQQMQNMMINTFLNPPRPHISNHTNIYHRQSYNVNSNRPMLTMGTHQKNSRIHYNGFHTGKHNSYLYY